MRGPCEWPRSLGGHVTRTRHWHRVLHPGKTTSGDAAGEGRLEHGGNGTMDMFSAESFAATLALLGIVIMVSALLSGLIERSGMPQVAVFLAIGAALGPAGLGALHLTLDSSGPSVIATLSLTLVLFTDALTL